MFSIFEVVKISHSSGAQQRYKPHDVTPLKSVPPATEAPHAKTCRDRDSYYKGS